MSYDIYCDEGHLCIICWAKERREAIGRWLFLRLPVRWRHRILMRAAMARRRLWRRLQTEDPRLAHMADPRSAHLERRMWRNLIPRVNHGRFPSTRSNTKIEWQEDDVWSRRLSHSGLEDPE